MRLTTLAAFGFGFAAGMACLATGLWWSGRLPSAHAQPQPIALVSQPEPALDLVRNAPTVVGTPAPPPVELERADRNSASRDATRPREATAARLAMPIAGVDPAKLRSNFDEDRNGHRHEALDIMSPRGTPVMAAAEGNVAKLFTSKQGGLTVYQFDNSQTLCYYYAHLDHYAPWLKEGVLLRKGDVLGYVGSTGDASPSAPHLHFAIFRLGPEKQWWKGTAVDPLPFLK